ncbi:MAG: hypothetical protein OXH94_04755 [Rhodospirillales bacterium]|nr:hypothetical protein [Rhodospirillales bacterium]
MISAHGRLKAGPVGRDAKLPDDKVPIPGVIDFGTNYVEHPRLIAQRILDYAGIVGRERVPAGADCRGVNFIQGKPDSLGRSR